MRLVDKIIVHHTCTPSSLSLHESFKMIDEFHRSLGWKGCGYHFLIHPNGEYIQSRSPNSIGAHCKGYNRNSIGIAIIGDYSHQSLSDAAFQRLCVLIKDLCTIYGYPLSVYPHSSFSQTVCPGKIKDLLISKDAKYYVQKINSR